MLLDPSAAEFRRRSQPAPCHAAAAGTNLARRHASRNLLKPPPQFLWRTAAQVILTNCNTCSSFIMKLSNSLFGRKKCCNVVKPLARLHVKSLVIMLTRNKILWRMSLARVATSLKAISKWINCILLLHATTNTSFRLWLNGRKWVTVVQG